MKKRMKKKRKKNKTTKRKETMQLMLMRRRTRRQKLWKLHLRIRKRLQIQWQLRFVFGDYPLAFVAQVLFETGKNQELARQNNPESTSIDNYHFAQNQT